MCADRKDDFKKGIKDKTQKRQDENLSLRKQKRNDKLTHRRVAVKQDDASTFEQMLASYDKNALLNGNLDQLKRLNRMLGIATKDMLDKHVHTLLFTAGPEAKPIVLIKLIDACRTTDPNLTEVTQIALTCLINLTGTVTSFELECAEAIVKAGFLQIVQTHIDLFLLGKHPTMDTMMHSRLWEVVIHLIISCPEARDIVLESPLMGFHGKCEAAANSTFMRDLAYVSTCKQELVPVLLTVICGIYEMNDNKLPPWLFTFGTWKRVIDALYSLQALPYAEMNDSVRFTLTYTLNIVFYCFKRLLPHESILLIGIAEPVRLMQKLTQLYAGANLINQLRIVQIFVRLGFLPSKESEFQVCMEKAGCVPLMMRTVQSNEERLRQHGFLWVGNFMADSVVFVQRMIQVGLMDALIPSIRRDKEHIRRNAVYALMTMFSACDQDRRNNMQYSEMANGVMFALVAKHGLFRWITPFIGVTGQEDVSCDVLNVVAGALRWNKRVTMEAIETADTPERVTMLLNQISGMKGSQYTSLYNAAITVDDLMNDRQPEVDRALMMEIVEEGIIAPGVYQGGFKF